MRLAFAALLFAVTASAQTFEQISSLRINEQPMSARTAAMGGASDALSSDGSDLAANPALIASLKRTVLSLSGAQSTFDIVQYEIIDNDVLEHIVPQNQRALAHVGAAVPWRGLVLGLYVRNEPRIGQNRLDRGPAPDVEYEPCDDCDYGLLIGGSAWERRDRRYGLTAAFERGPVSFGAGAELQDVEAAYETLRAPLSPISLLPLERITRRTSGRRVVPNVGLRWRVSPRVAVAAAYNGAATFESTTDVCTTEQPWYKCTSRLERVATWKLRDADAYRATLTVAPIERLVLTAEAVRRNYSKVTAEQFETLRAVYGVKSRDTTDLHAGAEYRLRRVPVSLRAGWQRQPAKISGVDFLGVHDKTVEHRTYGAAIDAGGARIDVAYDDADAPALRRAMVAVTFAMK